MEKEIKCHDCGRVLENNEEMMEYNTAAGIFVKCKSCHKADPALRNFQKAEVYSRVVGYIRPVAQWNKGKQAEYSDRKEFIAADGACC